MIRRNQPVWDHIKLILWVVLLFELIVFGLAFLFGRYLGYRRVFIVCISIGTIIGGIFLAIFLLNLLEILLRRIFRKLRK